MRFLLRFASFLALVVAVFAATVDAIQSVSASQAVLTPLGVAVSTTSPTALNLVQAWERPHADPAVWEPIVRWLLQQPAFALLLGVALLLWMVGYRRPPVAGRFSA